MEIHYQKYKDGVIVISCYGYDEIVVLPDRIDGLPVIALAPYAFSDGEEPSDIFVWKTNDFCFNREPKRLKTTAVTEIHLSKKIREIGKYAFYRCSNLQKLVFADEIMEIGGGALNGCRSLREVEIHLWNGEKSALKSVVDENRFEIYVKMIHHKENEIKIAELLFPEHYEEAVENTPARILYTSHHGAGGYYRQCFYNREVDYQKYDELLPWAIAGDSVKNVIRLALLRLRFPYKLSEKAKQEYVKYVKEHGKEAAEFLVEKEDIIGISFLLKNKLWDEAAILTGIEIASQQKKTDVLSFLMDEKCKLIPKRKKIFDL